MRDDRNDTIQSDLLFRFADCVAVRVVFFSVVLFNFWHIFFFGSVVLLFYFKKNKGREKRDEKNEKNSEIRAAPVGTGTWKNVVVANCKRNGTYFLLLYVCDVCIFITKYFFCKISEHVSQLINLGNFSIF